MSKFYVVEAAAVAVLAVIGFQSYNFFKAEYNFAKFLNDKACTYVANTGKSVVVENLRPGQVDHYKSKVYRCEGLGPQTYVFVD